MEILQFIFSSGQHFVGTIVLIYVIGEAIEAIVGAAAKHMKGRRNG